MADAVSEQERDALGSSGRYELRDSERGPLLECHDSPGILVRVDPGLGMSEGEARKLGERVILLDGAGQFGPLYDNERQLYNLDHHRSCVRSITLSTCEQALLLVAQGLPLDSADWTVLASTPDLDTVLAVWVLLNHRRVQALSEQGRDVLLPLLRMEGAIDANGAELARFCGLPENARRDAEMRLARLQQCLRELSSRGLSPPELTVALLTEVDRTVFGDDTLPTLPAVEQSYGTADLGDGQVAVVCRDGSGIYAVEPRLKERWGKRLSMIVLENAPGQYTLRRVSALKPLDLERAYDYLNLVDPAVDGRPVEKSWGGSSDIGGSPRPGGSALGPESLLEALRALYGAGAPRLMPRALLATLVLGTLTALSIAAIGAAGSAILLPRQMRPTLDLASLAIVLLVGAWLLIPVLSMRRSHLFGLRRPAQRWKRSLLLVPALLGLAWLGAGWIPRLPSGLPAGNDALAFAGVVVLAQIAIETAFRGLVHGIMVFTGPLSHPRRGWRLSRATFVSALLFAALTAAASGLWIHPPALRLPGLSAGAALLAGLLLGLLRERTLSIWPGVLLQILAAAGAIVLHLSLG
jgi:hypothetical protein